MMRSKNNQKGLSIVEAITAASILSLCIIVFMTLQSQQEQRFTLLRKFDKAAYAVDLMFEELTAVYNPSPTQYGYPLVNATTTPSNQITIKDLSSLPSVGDQFVISGVAGTYEITARTALSGNTSVFTIERKDIASDSANKNLASTAAVNAVVRFTFNANGSLSRYNSLDLIKFEDTAYQNTLDADVSMNLIKWGGLLKEHLGRSFVDDKRIIEVSTVNVNQPVDNDNDGTTDQIGGVDQFTTSIRTKVTIRIKQDNIEETFSNYYTNGS